MLNLSETNGDQTRQVNNSQLTTSISQIIHQLHFIQTAISPVQNRIIPQQNIKSKANGYNI
ncbi:hypothetical protein Hanom_Chr08g00751931 [Helianthus anomalus]